MRKLTQQELEMNYHFQRDVYKEKINLSNANLKDANLSNAYLIEADLSNADLENADYCNTILNQQCPEEGAFIAFKKLNWGVICKLQIT